MQELHFFSSGVETFGAYVVHCEKAEGLRERYAIGPSLQEFNVRIHASENRAQRHLTGTSSGKRPFGE